MKTKAQIVQELLDKNVITAEDAVILLTPHHVAVPYQVNPAPSIPAYPYNPLYPSIDPPYKVWCGTNSGGTGHISNNNLTIN